jgi:hypothetical protein
MVMRLATETFPMEITSWYWELEPVAETENLERGIAMEGPKVGAA